MKGFIKNHLIVILFSVTGAIGGFLYWKLVGCSTGTCFIKSVWYMATIYGLLLGYVTGGLAEELIVKFKKRRKI